jgi:hypothetical protein
MTGTMTTRQKPALWVWPLSNSAVQDSRLKWGSDLGNKWPARRPAMQPHHGKQLVTMQESVVPNMEPEG